MTFDINSFLTSTLVAQDKKLVSPGIYPALVHDLKVQSGIVGEGKKNAGQPWARLDIVFDIDSDQARQETGRSQVLITHGVMLNLSDSGEVVLTKGDRLDKLRKVLGVTNEPWSPADLKGRYGKVQIEHRTYNDSVLEDIVGILPA